MDFETSMHFCGSIANMVYLAPASCRTVVNFPGIDTPSSRDAAKRVGTCPPPPPPDGYTKIKENYCKKEPTMNLLDSRKNSGSNPSSFWFLVGDTLARARLAPSWTKSWLPAWVRFLTGLAQTTQRTLNCGPKLVQRHLPDAR